MNYLSYLLALVQLIPSIAADINAFHAGKSVSDKIAAASASLATVTQAAAAVLPPDQANLATVAGNAAQAILATTVQAVHEATTPATT